MGKYQITFNSKRVMTTNTYEAETIGEAMDEAMKEEIRWGGPPYSLRITILKENYKKN